MQEAIYRNLKGRTVIVIAHRLSTVEKANRIIVINKGCVEEQGTHQQLVRADGLYARLVHRQLTFSFDNNVPRQLAPNVENNVPRKPKPKAEFNVGSYGSFKSLQSNSTASDLEVTLTPMSRSPKFGSLS